MTEATMGHRRTGLTRAKRIERLTLWLGLPLLLLLLLSLTAGIVNYTPVRHRATAAAAEAPPAKASTVEEAPAAPSMPMRPDRLVPLDTPDDLGQNLQLEETPSVS